MRKKGNAKEKKRENKEELKQRKRMNREMAAITYIFMGLFLFMAGYVIWFLSGDTDLILNNPNNKRQELLAERIVKGSILSDQGKVLAKTVTDKDGNEKRQYPYDALFAHVVGRTSHGMTGLEASESYTMLTSGINPLTGLWNELKGKKNPGNNVVTTLNVKLSQVAGDALGGYRGAVVAMEPETGKILAMVSKPGYNPNTIDVMWEKLTEDSDDGSPSDSVLYNRATQGLYPPGSTFKLYTLLQYLRETDGKEAFSYTCKGKIGQGKDAIHCYGNEVHGKVDLSRAFAKSCNAAFAEIGAGLDVPQWIKLCHSLYYNRILPLERMEQKASSFQAAGAESGGDIMQAAIGQGSTLTTPLQNIYLVSAAVNGGTLMKPYLVDRVEDTYGNVVRQQEPVSAATPLTDEEARLLKQYMRETVESGTATALRTERYRAGGKTGSAEFKEGSRDSHAWFVGYAQKEGKTIAVSIIVEGAGTGSAYAVPIARKMFDCYFE